MASASPSPSTSAGASVPQAKLPISIRTLDGKTYKISAKADWTVGRLKEEFDEWRDHGSACVLFYRAKRLQDDKTLESYKIEPDSVIQANFRSTGGKQINIAAFVTSLDQVVLLMFGWID